MDIMGMFSLGGTISNILRLTSRPACIQIIKPNNLVIDKLTLCMCHVNTFTCTLYNETIITDFNCPVFNHALTITRQQEVWAISSLSQVLLL